MKRYTWSRKESDELLTNDTFDTVQECIEDAKKNGYEVGDAIAVGETKAFEVKVDAFDVIGRIEEQAFEECGEASDGWLSPRTEEVISLSERLTDCVNKWLKETGKEPKFYSINSIRIETVEQRAQKKSHNIMALFII